MPSARMRFMTRSKRYTRISHPSISTLHSAACHTVEYDSFSKSHAIKDLLEPVPRVKKKKRREVSNTQQSLAAGVSNSLQGYLDHKKQRPPRTLQ